ncbi:MAG: hypothetical protein AAF432_05455 [Planctomycetota bacterium]
MHHAEHPSHRGVAMLLVLVSLSIAVILSVAFLASRDNSAVIGDNTCDQTASRWAATSGLDIGVAIVQTNGGWEAELDDTALFRNSSVGEASVDVDVFDALTDGPPTEASRHIRLQATARLNGITQRASAFVTREVMDVEAIAVDVDLSEFALYARRGFNLVDQALVTRWTEAPGAAFGEPLALGSGASHTSSVVIGPAAMPVNATLFVNVGTSSSAMLNQSSQMVDAVDVPGTIPVPLPPTTPAESPHDEIPHEDLQSTSVLSLITDARHDNVTLSGSTSMLVLNDGVDIVTDHDFVLSDGARLYAQGQSTLVVFGDLILNDSTSIELGPDAELTIWVAGTVTVDSAYMGDFRADSMDRDTTGHAPWMNPERLVVLTANTTDDAWTLLGDSVIKGSMYAPHADVTMRGQSTIYGRVCAGGIMMHDESSVFYDPSLNAVHGYTNATSIIFGDTGDINDSLNALDNLDADSLQALADALGVAVASGSSNIGPTNVASVPTQDIVQLHDSTPRPTPVTYTVDATDAAVAEAAGEPEDGP